ncbi:unnamed protein product [Allacma fusca]|uniref:Uncharacterized protein n=1 Tax=Allacma fusca TaxID=39272 RepID=A0A8J2KM13_9HEXA|nr:unnamed protein product [Allacma fusca]
MDNCKRAGLLLLSVGLVVTISILTLRNGQSAVTTTLSNASKSGPLNFHIRTTFVTLTIGSPTDVANFPRHRIFHLTLKDFKEELWEDWNPKYVENIVSLRLNGMFSPGKARHLVSIMKGLTTLCTSNFNEYACLRSNGNKKSQRLTFGRPFDMPDLPEGQLFSLTLIGSKGAPWVDWHPQNANTVVSLRLVGTFSILEISHLLSICNNLNTICTDKLNEEACNQIF